MSERCSIFLFKCYIVKHLFVCLDLSLLKLCHRFSHQLTECKLFPCCSNLSMLSAWLEVVKQILYLINICYRRLFVAEISAGVMGWDSIMNVVYVV